MFTNVLLVITLIIVVLAAFFSEGNRRKWNIVSTLLMALVLQSLSWSYSAGFGAGSQPIAGLKAQYEEELENQKLSIVGRLATELPPSAQDYKVIGLGNDGTATADLIMVQELSLAKTEPRLFRIPRSLSAKSGSIRVGSRLDWVEGRDMWSIINIDENVNR